MKKIVKIVAIVVAVVLVAAFVAPMLLRGKIAQIVKREANEMLDARVDFEKLDISLLRHFPRASLDLKGLTVVGAGPFEGDTIVAANRISVVVNPMSLFGDDGFEVTKVILASPAVHAHKLADGAVSGVHRDLTGGNDQVADHKTLRVGADCAGSFFRVDNFHDASPFFFFFIVWELSAADNAAATCYPL